MLTISFTVEKYQKLGLVLPLLSFPSPISPIFLHVRSLQLVETYWIEGRESSAETLCPLSASAGNSKSQDCVLSKLETAPYIFATAIRTLSVDLLLLWFHPKT